MVKARYPLPRVGEYVVATVEEIFDYGAYVSLDEYEGLRAYLPWSEVSTRWIRSIRDVIKEGQKIVVKVIRVNRRTRAVDVSLKKVHENERRKKMLWWKRYMKAAKIIEIVAEKNGLSIDDAYNKIIWRLEDYYGNPMDGLEEAVLRGPEALIEAGVPEDLASLVYEEAKKYIKIKKVKIRGTLILRSLASDGVERIRKVLMVIPETIKKHGGDLGTRIYTLGAPRYVVEVEATDYKTAEKALADAIKTAQDVAKELQVTFQFERERK